MCTCNVVICNMCTQVAGTNSPDEALTAMRELPGSSPRDKDHLVPLVAEVVMDGELSRLMRH